MRELWERHKEVIAVVAVCLPLYFVRSWEGSLSGDALRYAAIAKTIVDTGDWLVLQDQPGVIYANKPPLMFWLIAATYKVFGVSLWAAKLWSAIFGAASAVVVYFVARRLFDRHVGVVAGFMAATCIYAVTGYGTVRLESVVTLSTVVGAYLVVRAVQDDRPQWLLLIGVAAGLGAMTKPVAPLHVYAVAVIGLGCLHRRWLLNRYLLFSAAVAVAIWAPWHIAAVRAGGDAFATIYFGREIGDRMITGTHFFVGMLKNIGGLLVGTIPWIAAFALVLLPRRDADKPFPRELAWFFGLWVAEVVITMSWPEKRYDRYMLVAFPAVVIPAAWIVVTRLPVVARDRVAPWLAGFAVAAILAISVLPIEVHRWRKMEFVAAHHYFDEFALDSPAAYFDSRFPTGPSTEEAQWSVRAATVYYIERSLLSYQTIDELEEEGVPLVIVQDWNVEPLEARGWTPVIEGDDHYHVYENPSLRQELGSEEYAARMEAAAERVEAMGDKPIL